MTVLKWQAWSASLGPWLPWKPNGITQLCCEGEGGGESGNRGSLWPTPRSLLTVASEWVHGWDRHYLQSCSRMSVVVNSWHLLCMGRTFLTIVVEKNLMSIGFVLQFMTFYIFSTVSPILTWVGLYQFSVLHLFPSGVQGLVNSSLCLCMIF